MSDVKYDGEYVLTADGSKDFGEISSEIAEVITGLISRRKSIENKLAKEKIRLLWQKPKQP